MKVTTYCPDCLKRASFDTAAPPAELDCACGKRRIVTVGAAIRDRRVVDICAICGSGYFYIEKDFNGWVGLGIMAVAIGGFLWVIGTNWFVAMGFLAGAAILDFVAYAFAGRRTVCYQCLAAYHGTAENPSHGTYDPGLAGRFADDYEEQRAKNK